MYVHMYVRVYKGSPLAVPELHEYSMTGQKTE